MKNSVKNLMPIPAGYVVLTKETTSRGVTWGSQEENGYDFRLAEYTDGITALYRVYTDGSIELDCESIMVQDLYCMHCGEPLNPCLMQTPAYRTRANTTAPPAGTTMKLSERMSDYERPCTH